MLYLDGVHFSIRHGDQADSTIILTALAVDLADNKEVLALRACAEEGEDGWVSVLHDLRARGATQIDLIVTDGHEGVLAAIADLFAATPRQRCPLHKQRPHPRSKYSTVFREHVYLPRAVTGTFVSRKASRSALSSGTG